MEPKNNLSRTTIFIFFTSFLSVQALNCYICAEAGLEEFGECKTSFPFSCDGYAKRFANDEKILCRTTRHKTANGTFTVVKECIADSAHHATFPRKPYELAEECDVLELNGVQVAYCLCRGPNLCNGAPIVGQFSAFEEKYPELFEPEPTVVASDRLYSQQQQQPSRELSQSAGDGDGGEELGEEPSLRPPEHRTSGEGAAAESTDFQMSTFHGPIVDGNVRFTVPPQFGSTAAQIPTTEENNPFVAPPTPPDANGNGHGMPEFIGTGIENGNVGSFVTIPLPTSTDSEERKFTASNEMKSSPPGTGSRMGTLPDLLCFQCGESNLPNDGDNCPTQIVVNCPDLSKTVPAIGRPLCVSRQIVDTKNNRFGVEKMCATERAILNEFGTRAVPLLNGLINGEVSCVQQRKAAGDGERNGDDGTVHQNLCLCSTAQCNGPSVGEQMHIANHQNGSSPTLTMRPVASTTPADTQTTKLMVEEQFLSTTANEPLNCAVCLDVELRNSESDCRSAHSQNCAHQMRAEKAFCLTRQTQNGKDAFIVEKSCVTKRQFYQQFPEELQKHGIDDVPLGCDATYDGFVNYCLCAGQMCNRNSLSQQAAESSERNGNKTRLLNSGEKHWAKSEENKPFSVPPPAAVAPKMPTETLKDLMPKINMQPAKSSAESVGKQKERSRENAFADDPSGPNWPTSGPNWPTSAVPIPPAPTDLSTPTLTRDRLQKWKQNSDRAKKPSKVDNDQSHAFGKEMRIVHVLLGLVVSVALL
uniref:Uncharacterized protein n=1 Tax=Globodera rostochiensis TaxID=31243 RepID=A0A914HZH3_GLORO